MQVARSVATEHRDLIHDVAYDYYGKRMATCSADNFVKIWDLIEGEWKCTASWKSHYGAVYRVGWAHPEFGQVILTCGFDRTTAVWEELPPDDNAEMRWIKRGNIVDSKSPVVDAKFGPKHLGFRLAMLSTDGSVNVYESPDVMNLSQWTLQHDFSTGLQASCLSWSHSRMHPATIAVGSDDPGPNHIGRVQIFEYNEPKRAWLKTESISTVSSPVRDVAFSPNLGRSYHVLAVASKDMHIFHIKPLVSSDPLAHTKYEVRSIAVFGEHQSQVWRLSWNVVGTVLASSGDDGCVRLWKANYMAKWRCIAELRGDPSDPVHVSAAAQLRQQASDKTIFVQRNKTSVHQALPPTLGAAGGANTPLGGYQASQPRDIVSGH